MHWSSTAGFHPPSWRPCRCTLNKRILIITRVGRQRVQEWGSFCFLSLMIYILISFFLFSAAAKVSYISKSKSIRLGMTVSLSCIGKGNPDPYVAWISPNGTMLQNTSSLTNTNLTINNVTRPFCGVYTCIASNMFGTDKEMTSIVCKLQSILCYIVLVRVSLFITLKYLVFYDT